MMPLARAQVAADSPGWQWPGSLVLRLVLVAMLAVALSGVLSAWLASRASEREAVRRLVGQQTEEVEVMARLLASKIEQSQKVLRTVAEGVLAWNPVFDVTPGELIDAIVTERGVILNPTTENMRAAFGG